jgi:chromosome partitioning protein
MIISFANHKGGTGKTTSAINFAAALRNKRKKILLIDTDPQGNLSFSMGITNPEKTVADLMAGEDFKEIVINKNKIDIIPAGMVLYEKENQLSKFPDKYLLLKNALKGLQYDFIIIDCSPSFTFYTMNVLCATDKVIIPMQMDVLSLQGLEQMINTLKEIKEEANPAMEIAGIIGVIVDERRQLTYEILGHIRENFNLPIFNNYIRANVKAAEAPSFAESVIDYAPLSNSAADYKAFAGEFLKIVQQ